MKTSGLVESEDIGALPPVSQFARYVLSVKRNGPQAEAGAMPAKPDIQALTGPGFPIARE
jgi:hypothetical protein